MAITVVQSTGNAAFSTSTSYAQAFGSNNTAGNTLVAIGFVNGVSEVISMSDNAAGGSNTWTLVKSETETGNFITVVFVAFNCKASATPITVTMSQNGTSAIGNLFCIAEISGVNTVDQVAAAQNVASVGGIATTPSISTAFANEIVIAALRNGLSSTATVKTPYAQLGAICGASSFAGAEYQIVSSKNTYSATFGTGAIDSCLSIIFSLYQVPTAGGGGGGLSLAMDASLRLSGVRH